MFSALLTLKGHVYEALDNRNFATDCYKEAVLKDINCFEALNSLLQHQLLTSSEGNVEINPIPSHILRQAVCSFLRQLQFH